MSQRQLVNWGEGYAQPCLEDAVRFWQGTYGQLHQPLLAGHGLVDYRTMTGALFEVVNRASAMLTEAGFETLSEWLASALGPPTNTFQEDVPSAVSRVVLACHKRQLGQLKDLVSFPFDDDVMQHRVRLLDVQMGIHPHLWVSEMQTEMDSSARQHCETQALMAVMSRNGYKGLLPSYLFGLSLSVNRCWATDIWLAADSLSRLTKKQLSSATKAGDWVFRGEEKTQRFWETVWRERQAYVLTPARFWVKERAGKPVKPVRVSVKFPELGAIPFYRVEQLAELHKAVLRSVLPVSLLGYISDSSFPKKRFIAGAREFYGIQRLPAGGRPRRDPERVREYERLVREEKMTVYGAAKSLKMPISTFRGYLKDYLEDASTSDPA